MGLRWGVRCRDRGEKRAAGEIKKIENPVTHVRTVARARKRLTRVCERLKIVHAYYYTVTRERVCVPAVCAYTRNETQREHTRARAR